MPDQKLRERTDMDRQCPSCRRYPTFKAHTTPEGRRNLMTVTHRWDCEAETSVEAGHDLISFTGDDYSYWHERETKT
jgi:hypothetical protein